MILSIVQIGWALQATYQWNTYLDIFEEELASLEPGLHAAQETSLLDMNNNYGLSNGIHNDWDTPLMSILFAPSDTISVIIAHTYGNIYHPVDPTNREHFPELEKYGITYTPYFNALQKQDSVHIPDRPLPQILEWFSTETVGENDYFEEE